MHYLQNLLDLMPMYPFTSTMIVVLGTALVGWFAVMTIDAALHRNQRTDIMRRAPARFDYSKPRLVTRDVRFIGIPRKEYPKPTQSGAEIVALRRQKRG
jgi:hypothetical protein